MTELSPLRTGRVTASRAPMILGLSPYGNAETVMRVMVRDYWGAEKEFTGNAATDYGHEHEADGIDYYEAAEGVEVTGRQEFAVHPEHPWMGYSPDGLVDEAGIVEVKCPWVARFTRPEDRPDIATQMAFQLEVAQGREWNDLVVWRPQFTVISRLYHDPTWLGFNLSALRDFHDKFEETVADLELSARHLAPLVDQRSDAEWITATIEYMEAKMDTDAAIAAQESAKARLVELADGKPTRGGGVMLLVTNPKGRVDTKALHAEVGINEYTLDQFRKEAKGEPTYTVRAAADKADR